MSPNTFKCFFPLLWTKYLVERLSCPASGWGVLMQGAWLVAYAFTLQQRFKVHKWSWRQWQSACQTPLRIGATVLFEVKRVWREKKTFDESRFCCFSPAMEGGLTQPTSALWRKKFMLWLCSALFSMAEGEHGIKKHTLTHPSSTHVFPDRSHRDWRACVGLLLWGQNIWACLFPFLQVKAKQTKKSKVSFWWRGISYEI